MIICRHSFLLALHDFVLKKGFTFILRIRLHCVLAGRFFWVRRITARFFERGAVRFLSGVRPGFPAWRGAVFKWCVAGFSSGARPEFLSGLQCRPFFEWGAMCFLYWSAACVRPFFERCALQAGVMSEVRPPTSQDIIDWGEVLEVHEVREVREGRLTYFAGFHWAQWGSSHLFCRVSLGSVRLGSLVSWAFIDSRGA